MANLSLINVNKVYPNNVHAVHDFSLNIKDKEFIVFVGPSGCGKSTTIRMIAGLEDISSGEFYIDGKLMNYVPSKDRDISMVFQNYALYPHMTVYRNMAYSLTVKKDYLPIYEHSDEVRSLLRKVTDLKRENVALAKALLKKNDEETKSLYLKNYKDIEDCLTDIYKARKPIIGRDGKRISRLKKELKKIDEELLYVEDWLRKEKEPGEGERDLSFIDMLEKDKASLEDAKKEKEAVLGDISSCDSEILKRRKLYSYEVDYEVYRAARILDLSLYLSRFPSELSGGQRQRVALGRAIVRRPKVFLMDEPLSNLDAKLRVQTRGEIARIHERVGATTIYVTHDQTEAMTLADRLVVMKDGYIQQIAKPMEAFENPVNMFVAGFIGSPSMNFIPGLVDGESFAAKDEKGNTVFTLSLDPAQTALLEKYQGKEIVLGIRPENLSIDPNGEIPTSVDSVELLGSEFILYSSTGFGTLAIKTDKPVSPSLRGLVRLAPNKEKLYFFDKDTTLRIKDE